MAWKKPIFQMIMIMSLFIPLFVFKYYVDIETLEKKTLRSLSNISNTAIVGFPLEALDSLLTYSPKVEDHITSNTENPWYLEIHQYLREIQEVNQSQSPIYLLIQDKFSPTHEAFFLVTSANKPYYYHHYEIPNHLALDFQESKSHGPYEDGNGIWLSSYSTLNTSNSKYHAILQVDKDIRVFRAELAENLFIQAVVLATGFGILSLLFLWVSSLIKFQNKAKLTLETTHKETGLLNVKGLQIQFENMRSSLTHPHFIILSISLIEEIRDKLGQDTFYQFQREVVKRIQSNFPENTQIFYLEIGEFGILIDQESCEDELIHFSQITRTTFTLRYNSKPMIQKVNSSIGSYKVADPSEDIQSIVSKCQIALRKHRRSIIKPYVEYSEDIAQEHQNLLDLESDIPEAIREEQFEIYYQAKVDCTGALGGAEALLRWNHPEKGLISPGIFIPILEESGMIHQVGLWVLHKVAQDTLDWNQRLGFQHKVSANVSMTQFDHPDFEESISNFVADHYDICSQIEIEITESTLSQEYGKAVSILKNIQEMGVPISIDDFGTGYSNLHQLISIPFDTLKLDRSFVMGLPEEELSQSSSKLVIGLAQSLGKTLVAEGVETQAQHDWLCDAGADLIQGFYWSKPCPKAKFEEQFFKTL